MTGDRWDPTNGDTAPWLRPVRTAGHPGQPPPPPADSPATADREARAPRVVRMPPRHVGRAPTAPGSWSRFLLARLPWILLITLAVTAGAAVLAWTQTPTYTSEADVVVYPASSQAGSSVQQTADMGTEKGIASSGAVLALASRSLQVPERLLQNGESVSVPVDTELLTISFSDPNRYEARRLAQGLARAYVTFRNPKPQHVVKVQGKGKLAKSVTVTTPAVTPPGAVQAAIITPASLPLSPSSPNRPLDVGVALLAGLVLGLGTALVRDRIDDRLRGPVDLAERTDAPVLAVIPAFRRRRSDSASGLVMLTSPGSAVAEAYRNLRTRVLQVAGWRGASTILVTCPGREDKATVAANLAAAVAQSGRRVTLVCADLRWPRVHGLFGLEDDEAGLTSVLYGRADLATTLRRTGIRGLQVLPAGPPPPDPGALPQSPVLREVLDELRSGGDFVVVDAPPVLAGADAGALAELAPMILLVSDARRSRRAQVRAAVHELGHVREKVIGCVLSENGWLRRLPRLPLTSVAASEEAPEHAAISLADQAASLRPLA
jgi:tyrosine-protein kinase